MPYHTKGIGKNKKIREERKKPLPLSLMVKPSMIDIVKNDKTDRIRINRGRNKESAFNSNDI